MITHTNDISSFIPYIKNSTPEIYLELVKKYGEALQYIKEQTEEICLEAVKRNCWLYNM